LRNHVTVGRSYFWMCWCGQRA